MQTTQKTSSSFKVGILTVTSILILIFTVMWIKGRSLSAGERLEVKFLDVNGMRAGSGVQMMGLRVGQVEEVLPIIKGKDSYVKVRFVITEKGVDIPELSTISIQQSGLIGEQFLEITPPKTKHKYTGTDFSTTQIKPNTKIYMIFDGNKKEIGYVQDAVVYPTVDMPADIRSDIKTKNTLKLSYMITVAGLIINSEDIDFEYQNNEIIFKSILDEIKYPESGLKYTVVEPMRLSDFMDLQYKSAKSLNETNDRIAKVLNDEFIYQISESVTNINTLTHKAISTVDKANMLIDSSRKDMDAILAQSEILLGKLGILTDNVNDLIEDKDFKNTILETAKSLNRLSGNVNRILEDEESKELLNNLNDITNDLASISDYVNEFTKEPKVKESIVQTVENVAKVTENINKTLENLDNLPNCEKANLKASISDLVEITRNLKTFSQKLNKRFLLFRLMF